MEANSKFASIESNLRGNDLMQNRNRMEKKIKQNESDKCAKFHPNGIMLLVVNEK